MAQPKSILNTAEFSVRCFKPLYAQGDVEYTPWFIGHPDEQALSDDCLMARFVEWETSGGLERCEDSLTSGFASHLEGCGYVVFWSPEDWLWILPVACEEDSRGLQLDDVAV